MTDLNVFRDAIKSALERRTSLLERLHREGTDCYRLFHGTQEGAAGVTLDRYGDLALLQSFHDPLPDGAQNVVACALADALPGLDLIYNDRSGPGSRVRNDVEKPGQANAERERIAREHGVRFQIKARHRGQDPWLFLDLRTTRRSIMEETAGKTFLNLFSYTCGAGIAAAVAGATRVVNVDFSKSALAVGTANAALNGVSNLTTQLESDVFPALRQFAGIRQTTATRGRRLPPFPRVDKERFDIVLLDPPPLAKSRFGVVDVIRDYQSMLKPSLATVVEGGVLYCTNNSARVDEREWHALLHRSAQKHGRPIHSLDVLKPGDDFPSMDGRPPLKVARLEL